ncbi:transmembrane amino acid transporter protein-domain-containing protein [Ochromonadaceae sp. CCMP2298]|nr:transmembrane amino acid transporter protein-domain-containing protein [Ochromonadaceae sp. CCMP2298]
MEESSRLSEKLYESTSVEVDTDSEPLVSNYSGQYFLFLIPMEWIYISDGGRALKPSNGPTECAFLLLNTMIGSGILLQAHVFMKSGILWTTMEYIVVGFASWLSVKLMIEMSAIHNVYDYTGLCDKVFGARGSRAADAGIVFAQGGSLISYVLVIGLLFAEVVKQCSDWYCNQSFLAILSLTVVTVPLCLIRNFGHLVVASVISVVVISSLILLVVVGGPMEDNSGSGQYKLASPVEGLKNIGAVVFALEYVVGVYFVYNSMKVRNKDEFTIITAKTSIFGCLLCYIVGLAGYLSFRTDTEVIILQNFDGPVGGLFKFCVAVHLLLFFPGELNILRVSFLKLCDVDMETQSNASFSAVTAGLLVFFLGLGVILQNVSSDSLLLVL